MSSGGPLPADVAVSNERLQYPGDKPGGNVGLLCQLRLLPVPIFVGKQRTDDAGSFRGEQIRLNRWIAVAALFWLAVNEEGGGLNEEPPVQIGMVNLFFSEIRRQPLGDMRAQQDERLFAGLLWPTKELVAGRVQPRPDGEPLCLVRRFEAKASSAPIAQVHMDGEVGEIPIRQGACEISQQARIACDSFRFTHNGCFTG